jgi:PleD family two-component response regulator
VILAILDDLMFTSKLRTAATHVGVPLAFVRSSMAAIEAMQATTPKLVIVDLNNARIDPLGIVATMKANPALADVPTVGFSHHSEVDTIAAARRAGVTEVLARGAFFERLPDILMRAAGTPGRSTPPG